MDKTYNPQSIEKHWYDFWEKQQYFAPSGTGKSYCIMIPPPNVTGNLHMGHGFQLSLMDALIRYHRMRGFNTLWQVGTDHAGIATQMVVERELAKQNITRQELGRDEFVKKVWEWKTSSGNNITNQIRRLGASVDWNRERFTMDDALSDAVQDVFIKLHAEGLIYRGKRLVNWDPKFHTAISDLEVVSQEEDGNLWYIRYPVVDSEDSVVVATTRPETMFGDVAVAIHPEDKRYSHLHGKQVHLPLCNREIPIILDDSVQPEFGTGCVKITPAHDFNDNQLGLRHKLPMINIMTEDACMNENAPHAYQGIERFAARKQIIADLKDRELLVKTEPYKVKIPRGDRSGVVVEPLLTDQWFINMNSLAEPAIDAVASKEVRFVPENWQKIYFQWLENIEDWCISRQLWWGHRIPAWYDENGKVYVGKDEQSIRKKHKLKDKTKLKQDEDVLDTWFSSALWPFSTLGWPEDTNDLETFYPTDVLVTGFDIIFFWVARMIMMALKFTDKVPFEEVYITGLIRDSEGQKMSKSKGNILDPLDLIDGIELEPLIEKRTSSLMLGSVKDKIIKQTREEFPDGIAAHGTDAVRFTFCVLASTGRDIRFDIQRLEGYRNFCNKLWNAARYVLMNTENQDIGHDTTDIQFSVADRWIRDRLQLITAKTHEHYSSYRFDLLCKDLYDFIWREYCDWYLELSKPTIYSETASDVEKRGARYTLITVLEQILRLLHPLMPYITEEIWQRVKGVAQVEGDSIMTQTFPEVDDKLTDTDAVEAIEWMKNFVLGVRNIRGEMNIPPTKQVPVLLHKASVTDIQFLDDNRPFLMTLAKLSDITVLKETKNIPISAMALAGKMEILIPMAGLIDKHAEISRLEKEIVKCQKELERIANKLENPKFVNKAPKDIVAKEKKRLNEVKQALSQLEQQQQKISAL